MGWGHDKNKYGVEYTIICFKIANLLKDTRLTHKTYLK